MRSLTDLTTKLPQRADFPRGARAWRADLVAGVTVGVVALPLALGFGVASGAGASAGLVTAVVAGIVAALFGGSQLQVSGPTGAMTVVLLPAAAEHGVGALPVLAFLAGVFVVLAALMRLGRAVTLVPWPVVEGFTLGIGLVIFLQQLGAVLAPGVHGDSALLTSTWRAITHADPTVGVTGLAVAMAVVVLAAACTSVRPTWPASLVALAVVSGACVALDARLATLGSLSIAWALPAFPTGLDAYGDLVRAAFVVAVLAALESLLSARVADGMTDTESVDPDRELFGQGLANVAAGMAGGVPATGAIARTAVNVRAGARTRVAAMTHGVVILFAVVAGGTIMERVPLAALAGVLMFTALRMIDVGTLRVVVRASRSDAVIYVSTAAATLVFDLVRAVELGIAIAALLALRAAARQSAVALEDARDHVDEERLHELLRQHVVVYRLQGSLFFGAAQRFMDRITTLEQARVVVLRLGALQLLDSTGAVALAELVDDLRRRDIHVLVCGVRSEHERILRAFGIPGDRVGPERVFRRIDHAIEQAADLAATARSG